MKTVKNLPSPVFNSHDDLDTVESLPVPSDQHDQQKTLSMTLRHYQYLFYSLLSSILSAYGFADKLDIRGDQQNITPAYFGILFAIFGIYFFMRFMKTKFKQNDKTNQSDEK